MTSTVEFARQEVALDGVDNWRDALQAIEAVIASVAMAPSDHSVLRLELTGETPLAWRLRRDHDLLLEQVSNLDRAKGSVWIDKIVHRLAPPSQGTQGEDPRRELGALMDALIEDGSFMTRAARDAEDLIGDLPPELRSAFGETESSPLGPSA